MNEEKKKKIIEVLKEFLKLALKDAIIINSFMIFIAVLIMNLTADTFLEPGDFLRFSLELYAAIEIIRGFWIAVSIILILCEKNGDQTEFSEEGIKSINSAYSESLEDYKEVFDLGSPILTKYLNNPNGSGNMNQDVFVAGLADLIRKNKVRIDGPFLVVIDNDVSLESEKFLLTKIKEGRFVMGTASSFYSDLGIYAAKDLVDGMKLLEKAKPKYRGHGKMILLAIIVLIICTAVAGEDSGWYEINELLVSFLAIYGVFYAISLSALKPTKTGERLNRKIEGLKKYLLKSYEVLAQNNDEELMNQYLLHTIAFGHNPKMVEEYMKFVDITPEPEA